MRRLENKNPFELARSLKVIIEYHGMDNMYGYYTPLTAESGYEGAIFINSGLSLEDQEKVCDHLIYHCCYYKRVPFGISEHVFRELEKTSQFSAYAITHKKLINNFV